MDQIFYWILNMGIIGSILGIILLLLRRIKILPRNFIYAMYAIVGMRFLCPVGVLNGFSLLRLLPRGSIRLIDPMTMQEVKEGTLAMTNTIQMAKSYEPFLLRSDGWKTAYGIASYVWGAIMCTLFLFFIITYWLTKSEYKKAVKISDGIYQSENTTAPMVIGVINPKIVIPCSLHMDDENYTYMISHEKMHMRKHDNLFRIIAIFIGCIYWFLPLVWILLKYFFTDMELACDESTIRTYDLKERKKYAFALVTASRGKTAVYASAFAKGSVSTRVKRVLDYQKLTTLSSISFILLLGLFAVCFLSNSSGGL